MSEPPVPDADPTNPAIPLSGVPGRAAAPNRYPRTASPDDDERITGQLSLGERLRQPRTLISIAIPIVLLALILRAVPERRLRRARRERRGRQQAAAARGTRRVLRGLPAARQALVDAAPGDRRPGRHQGLDRDHPAVLARELPRAGEARRPVPRLPAEAERGRLGLPDGRHDLHRADPRPVHDRPARPAGGVLELPQRLPAGDPVRRGPRHRRHRRARGLPVRDPQLRARDHPPPAPARARPRPLRPLRGGPAHAQPPDARSRSRSSRS